MQESFFRDVTGKALRSGPPPRAAIGTSRGYNANLALGECVSPYWGVLRSKPCRRERGEPSTSDAKNRRQKVAPGSKFVACWLILIGGCLSVAAPQNERAQTDSRPHKTASDADFSFDHVPRGLEPQRPVPQRNPLTEVKVELGRALFFDTILSANRDLSCATCHEPQHGFAQARALPVGHNGQVGRRNAPTLLNRAYGKAFFWDGRAATLEEQALRPIESEQELAAGVDEVVRRLHDSPQHRRQFEAAFEDGVTAENLARAIASFERTLLAGDSPVDRFRAADFSALTESERQGLWLFESRGHCWRCHSGPNFSDEKFHNTGVSWGKMPADLGRYEITGVDEDRGRFKTPTLRGVALTAPYMHDGSIATLEEVVDFYNRGGGKNPHLDPLARPLELTPDEVSHLVAFLRALSRSAED